MIDYCIWLINTDGDYIATCKDVVIDSNNYIDKYCTCCGRKIVTPFLYKTYNDNFRKELNYAN